MTRYPQRFYIAIDWFAVEEQPKPSSRLPIDFKNAQALWRLDPDRNAGQVAALLQPYLSAIFLVGELANWKSLFACDSSGRSPETHASSIRIVGVDFGESPIPRCRAEAEVTVDLRVNPNEVDFNEWQENNARFYDAVSFFWSINKSGGKKIDYLVGDHLGLECVPIIDAAAVRDEEAPNTTSFGGVRLYCPVGKPRDELLKFLEAWSDDITNLSAVMASTSDQLELLLPEEQHQDFIESLKRGVNNGFLSSDIMVVT
ncbi:MAG: hypothetical protein FJ184_09170 [Gammaproteobacteria bacterium]|nr:hypothetical protein [Gammaproteobacteria bacterium]